MEEIINWYIYIYIYNDGNRYFLYLNNQAYEKKSKKNTNSIDNDNYVFF